MLKKILIVLFFQSIIFIAGAQTALEFIVTPYNKINGISTKSISDILQGSEGYIWIGSSQGLIRFDGNTFKTITNEPGFSNSINKIAQDKNENIWLALDDGSLAKFNPLNASFTNIKIKFPDQNSTEKPGSVESVFFDKDNNLWLGITRTGLVRVNTNTGNAQQFNVVQDNDTYYSPEIRKYYNRVLNIYEDENKLFWLATPDGLYTFNRITGRMKQISKRPVIGSNEFRNDNYRNLIRLKNKLWLAAWGGGLSSYDLLSGKFEVFKSDSKNPNEYTNNIFQSIVPKNDSEILIASADKGFMAFNINSHKQVIYSNNPQYKNIPVWLWTKLICDKDNNIWALNEAGLMKIQIPDYKFKFHSFPVKHSDNQIFYSLLDVFENDNVRLVTTYFTDGLQIINKKTLQQSSLPIEKMMGEGNVNIIIKIKKDSSGNIWVLTRDYIYQYDQKANKLIKPLQPPLYQNKISNSFSNMGVDIEGNIWFCTLRNGIFLYNNKAKKYIQFNVNQDADHYIPTSLISGIACDKAGRIWFSSNRGFLTYYDLKTKIIQSSSKINSILKGLHEKKIFDLFADNKGFLWASTKLGLVKIDCKNTDPTYAKTYTSSDGLYSEFIVGLAEDSEGKIWGTESNVFAVCMIDEKRGKILNYGVSDGINHPGELYRLVNLCNNRIWLLGQGGYYEFDPLTQEGSKKLQPLAITIMAVNSIEVHFQEEIKKHKKVMLGPDENSFYFEFAAIDFTSAEVYQFAYKLEGFDTGWTYCGNRKAVSYTNIPGGDYIFKVKSTTESGVWNTNYTSVPFFIKTKFYKKWWFSGIIILLIFSGLYFFYHFKMNKQKQISLLETKAHALGKEKSKIQYENIKQQLNPHFLFNSLTALSSLIRVDQKLAIEFLSGMSKIYRYILQSKDEELIEIKEEIKFIQTFIQLQKTSFEEGLLVNIHVEESVMHKKIVPVTLQNLIENSIKHNIINEKRPLTIEIFAEKDYLIIRNNLQKKKFVESSNKQGLDNLVSLYHYLSEKPLLIDETTQFYTVKIPLI